MATEENTASKEIRVGVIGCGRIGIVHLGAITKAPNVTPVIVSNPTVSKAEAGELYIFFHVYHRRSEKIRCNPIIIRSLTHL